MAAFLPIIALFGVMYFLLIRPQQQQTKRHAAFVASLAPGQEVVTSSGIYGTVTEVEDIFVWLEVAKDLELKVERAAIGRSAYDDDDDDETVENDDETAETADEES